MTENSQWVPSGPKLAKKLNVQLNVTSRYTDTHIPPHTIMCSHPHTSHLSCIHTYIPSRCCHVFTPTYQPPTIMYSHKHMLQIHWHPHTTKYYHVLTPIYQPPIMYSHLHTIQMLPCIHTHIPATYHHVLSQTYAPDTLTPTYHHILSRAHTHIPITYHVFTPTYHPDAAMYSHPHTSHLLSCTHTHIPPRYCHVLIPTYHPDTAMYSHPHTIHLLSCTHTHIPATYYHVLTPTYHPPIIMYSHPHTIQILSCTLTHIPSRYRHVLTPTYHPLSCTHCHAIKMKGMV